MQKKLLITAALAVAVGFELPAMADTTAVSVDFGSATGQMAGGAGYSLNIFQAFDSSTAQNAVYQANVDAMDAAILRYHNEAQILDSVKKPPYGWVFDAKNADCAWDQNKIDGALGVFSYAPTVMMDISNWPKCFTDKSRLLANVSGYASFSASLVPIVDPAFNVKNFELFNELDLKLYHNNMGTVGQYFAQVEQAMKDQDSTIQVGGPAFGREDRTADLDDFFNGVATNGGHVDFVTFHTYAFCSKPNSYSTTDVYNAAPSLAIGALQPVETSYQKYFSDSPPYYLDEWNINGCHSDVRMTNAQGAVFDALVLIGATEDGVPGTMLWNECSSNYGTMDGSKCYTRRPSSYLYQALNDYMQGPVYASTPDDMSTTIVPLAVESATSYVVELVNRSEAASTVQLTISGIPNLTSDTAFTVEQVSLNGLNQLDSVTYAQLQAGYALPVDTITFLSVPQ